MIAATFLDEIRARVPVSAVVGRKVKLVRAGRETKGCCPFHNEKTPSFYVNDDKGFYHCFGCGAHGDVIRFTIEQEGLPFRDAVETLAAQAGLEMPAESDGALERARAAASLHDVTNRAAVWFAEQLAGADGASARAYLDKRGLSPEIAKAFRIGLAPDGRTRLKAALSSIETAKLIEAGMLVAPDGGGEPYDRFRGRLMFPIRDPRGRVIAFGGRVLGDGQPKYLNSPDTPLFDKGRTLYNLDRAGPVARKSGRLLVVEGYMDVIGLAQAGFADAVAPLGTALTEAQLEMMWRVVPEPVLCFDGDAAGHRAAVRAATRALPLLQPGQSLRIATLPLGIDPDDLVREQGSAAFERVIEEAKPLYEFIWDSVIAISDASTPELRALIQKTLRDYSDLIVDTKIRTQYDIVFRERFWLKFGKRSGNEKIVYANFQSKQALQALHVPTHDHETVSIVIGCMNYPSVVVDMLEFVSRLPLTKPKLVTLMQAIIDTVAWHPELTRQDLADALRAQGYGDTMATVRRSNRLPFSFTNPRVEEERAANELSFCIELMVELDEISRQFGSACINAVASLARVGESPEQAEIAAGFERAKVRGHQHRLQALARLYEYVEDRRHLPPMPSFLVVSDLSETEDDELAYDRRKAA